MAAKGYPGDYEKGSVIEASMRPQGSTDVEIFHAGTARQGRRHRRQWRPRAERLRDGQDGHEAQARAYQAVDLIHWPEGFCRRDIAWQAVAEEKGNSK